MNNKLNIFTEQTENSRFAVIGFQSLSELIDYQLKMLTNNNITYLLSTTLQQMDGNIKIYYDISDKMSLEEYGSKSRFNVSQFLKLLNCLINIDNEIDEYQLINSGILFDPKWVFVDKDGENAEFIYIPNAKESSDSSEIKAFLMKILQSGLIDSSAQDIVTNLFMLLQDENMSMRDLKDLIYRFEGRSDIRLKRNKVLNSNNIDVDDGIEANEISAASDFSDVMKKQTEFAKPSFASKPSLHTSDLKTPKPPRFSPKNNVIAESKSNTLKKSNATKVTKKDKKEKSTLPITLTVLGNIVILALVYKVYTLGFLSEASGEISITRLGVLFVAILAINVIIIINLFAKYKGTEKIKESKVKKVKEPKTINKNNAPSDANSVTSVPNTPEKPINNIPSVPKKPIIFTESKDAEIPKPIEKPSVIDVPKENKIPNISEISKIVEKPATTELQKAAELPNMDEIISTGNDKESSVENTVLITPEMNTNIELDETVLMVNNEPKGYIERIENDEIADRYVIKKDRIIIGRMRSKVDMTVLNPKVGKIHAEVNYIDGKFYIKDICSKNGTYLSGASERIKSDQDYELNDGEKFRLADSDFCIRFIK